MRKSGLTPICARIRMGETYRYDIIFRIWTTFLVLYMIDSGVCIFHKEC